MGNSPEKARHLESIPRNLYPLFCLTNNKGGKENAQNAYYQLYQRYEQ